MNIPAWQPDALEGILALMLCTLGFTAYHFLSLSPKIRKQYERKHGPEKGHTRMIFFQRYIGLLCLGVIPGLIMLLVLGKGPGSYGVGSQNLLTSLYWTLGLGAIVLVVNYFNTRSGKKLDEYPMIREKNWSRRLIFLNAFSWFAYLLGYEFMFRGILLFGLLPLVGVWPAIAINAALYAYAHIPKNLQESIGAIPFGVILCLITLDTGTLWVALFVHVIRALSNSFFSLAVGMKKARQDASINNH
jgi:membrane protease YdiL (CAAX protease family)